jgi:hypothetical protein
MRFDRNGSAAGQDRQRRSSSGQSLPVASTISASLISSSPFVFVGCYQRPVRLSSRQPAARVTAQAVRAMSSKIAISPSVRTTITCSARFPANPASEQFRSFALARLLDCNCAAVDGVYPHGIAKNFKRRA